MFRRNRAAERIHRVVDDAAHLGAATEERGVADVVVQVAVADVAEAENRHARKRLADGRVRALDELRHLRHGDRDVVLDVGELRFRNRLPDRPEGLRFALVLGDDGVRDSAFQRLLELCMQVRVGSAVAQLHQHRPRAARQRVANLRAMGEHGVDAVARKEFEGGEPVAAGVAQVAEQFHGALRVRHFDPRGRRCGGPRMQLQHGRGNDAQRALGADEKLLQVVAGVVLAQGAQPVPQAPVGQHRFQPEHLVARVAVAQHVDAARIGREVAADLAAAFGAERKGEQAVRLRRRALHVGEHAAGLDGDGVVERVQFADAVHARERKHDFRARAGRHRAAAQPGIAALRNDRRCPLRRTAARSPRLRCCAPGGRRRARRRGTACASRWCKVRCRARRSGRCSRRRWRRAPRGKSGFCVILDGDFPTP